MKTCDQVLVGAHLATRNREGRVSIQKSSKVERMRERSSLVLLQIKLPKNSSQYKTVKTTKYKKCLNAEQIHKKIKDLSKEPKSKRILKTRAESIS